MSTLIPLESVRVASPCRADWDKMEGDDHARFCQTCAKNVYNLSSMSKAEAENLIREKEGNLCVRFYQREDGTILTSNCPVELKIVRRPLKWLAAGFVALLVSGVAIFAREQNTQTAPKQARVSKPITLDAFRKVPVIGYVVNYFSLQPVLTMGMTAFLPPSADSKEKTKL